MRFISRFINSQTASSGQVLTADGSGNASWITPTSGGSSRSVTTVTTNTVMGASANTDYFYNASGTITLTLPTAVGNSGEYTVKNIGTGIVTIATTSGQTIDGSSTAPIVNSGTGWATLNFYSDGANWFIS